MHYLIKYFFLIIGVLVSWFVHGQGLELLSPLSTEVVESSALIYVQGRLITINDSGGEPILYELDPVSGNVQRTVAIANASNTDWEALTADSTYIYLGDFGNNSGTRTDLKIFRISISDYFNTLNDTVTADQITFHYHDQTDFSPATFTTNYDAEAFTVIEDSLYIFTKNWSNFWTNIYPLAKTPGDYPVFKSDSINVQGLVTDATFNAETGTLMLSGHTFLSPFSVSVSNFEPAAISDGIIQHYNLSAPPGYSYQIEGVAGISPALYYFTSEEGAGGDAGLYQLNLQSTSIGFIKEKSALELYPNPAANAIVLRGKLITHIEIFTLAGRSVLKSKSGKIDISSLHPGLYSVKAFGDNNRIVATRKFIVN